MGRAVLQYSHCISNMARQGRTGRVAGAHEARGTGAERAAWACCWAVHLVDSAYF